MAFSVSYTYKIIDKYTPKLREIQKQTDAFNKKMRGLQVTANEVNDQLRESAKVAGQAAKSYGRASDKMAGGSGKFRKAMGRAKGKLDSFANSASGLIGVLGGGFVFKQAADEAFSFEESMTDLRRVFGDMSKSEMKSFQTELARVGDLIGQSETNMNRLAFQAGKLGVPVDEISEFSTLAGKVKVAFDTDLGQATNFLAELRSKLNLNNKGLESTLDTVNRLSDTTEASATDILNITRRLSGVFKALKIPPEVGAGFATVARRLEVSPERAATGMKMFLQRLQDTNKFGPEVAESLVKDVPGTIDKVLAKFREMPQAARNVKIQELFGAEAAPFVMNLVESQKLMNETLKTATDQAGNAGSMTREFNRVQGNGAEQARKMREEIKDMTKNLMITLLPVIKELIGLTTKFVRGISEFAKANPVITKLAVGAAALLVALMGLGLAISVATTAAAALAPILGVIGTILGVLLSPVGLVVAAVAALAAGLVFAWKKSETFRNAVKGMVNWLSRLTGIDLMAWAEKAAGAIGDVADSVAGFFGFGGDEGSMTVRKETTNQSRLDGQIKVEAGPNTKVTGGRMKSTAPGNLGLNLAGAQ